MKKFVYNDNDVLFMSNDPSVLESLELAGHYAPSDCLSGHCNFCLLKLLEGQVCSSSQHGLSQKQIGRGLLKSCVAKVNSSIVCNDQIYNTL
jgi:ferredoxin